MTSLKTNRILWHRMVTYKILSAISVFSTNLPWLLAVTFHISSVHSLYTMMSDMSLHPYPKGAHTGCQISILQLEHECQLTPFSLCASQVRLLLALALLAARGLLAPDTWKCKRAQVSLKAIIDVPMLRTIIEQNGDGLLEDSHMPVGWPLHIDGAVRQCCIHRSSTQQELDDMLKEYDMKRDSVEINYDAPQWSHNAVWNRRYMEPKRGYTLRQLWADSEPAIGQKSSPLTRLKRVTFYVQ